MSGQVVIPSPGQARPYAGTPRAARAHFVRPSADPGGSQEPGASRRVPDRGDDLKPLEVADVILDRLAGQGLDQTTGS